MTQEHKDLLLKDLCSRLPYRVKCKSQQAQDVKIGGELLIDINIFGRVNIGGHLKDIDDIKPYLFPLSSMTDKQMKELIEMCGMHTPVDDYELHEYLGISVLYKYVNDDNYKFDFETDVINWFLQNHFDINNLIPKGLAIDCTNLNIY